MVEHLHAGGARKRRAVKLTGETQVFEEGSMGEAPGGGSLSTYKELCALATDMGQPDLVYRFMDLANHHASLNSSRGAAFGYAASLSLLTSGHDYRMRLTRSGMHVQHV